MARPEAPLKLTLRQLRAHTVLHTFAGGGGSDATGLKAIIERLGFVQADPIRAPARAQDLILHQRLERYRAGDLERHYPALGIEEGFLYAYGFLTRSLWQLRHPPVRKGLSRQEQRVLSAVHERGEAHPDQLRDAFGGKRAINAWGSYSSVVKLALERLHARGLLRVTRRDGGIRVYAPRISADGDESASPEQRFEALLGAVVRVLAPVPERSLRSALYPHARGLGGDPRAVVAAQLRAGLLQAGAFEGATYLWPGPAASVTPPDLRAPPERRVRLVAPFDPLVWDRQRFEQLWGWPYRFEAYTPVAKRVRGYYALPLLWVDRVIGWANLAQSAGELSVELGFVGRRPREREFSAQLEAEVERMRAFLDASPPG